MTNTKGKVFIVDDDDAVRDSLCFLLTTVNLESESYESGDQFLANFDEEMSGCLLLDIRMPGTSGIEVQKRLKELNCELPVIFVTGHGDVPMAVEAMQSGAFDFIQKPFRDQDLLDRIYQALETYERQEATSNKQREIGTNYASLTPREQEVMEFVVKGAANKVIAIDLGVSQRTVEIHRARVMEKMQARSLAELVRMSIILSL
jgi:FixJ family two-component response regulator